MVIIIITTKSLLGNVKHYLHQNFPNFSGRAKYYYSSYFLQSNQFHRFYGPAIIWGDDDKYWYFSNKFYEKARNGYSQKQFIKDLSKLWLL